MNKDLLHVIFIFAATFLLLLLYSFYNKPLEIWGFEIKKTGIEEALTGTAKENLQPLDSVATDSIKPREPQKPKMDSASQDILLIGDSMLEGLMLRMQDYAKYNDHNLNVVIWYSSTSEWYGSTDTLSYFINKYNPTYIMLVLGANELFVRDIIERRNKYVKNILKDIGGRKFIWIGPPNWTDDTGINKLIQMNTGEGRYFPSRDLSYDRYKDGAHPTHKSAAKWMDSVAAWVMEESRYPMLLEEPDTVYKDNPNVTLLQPLD